MFGGYEATWVVLGPPAQDEAPPIWKSFIAGGIGGTTCWGFAFPLDVIKSRVQVLQHVIKSRVQVFIKWRREVLTVWSIEPNQEFRYYLPHADVIKSRVHVRSMVHTTKPLTSYYIQCIIA